MSEFCPVRKSTVRKWRRRAVTILLKSQEIGTDNHETDFPDAVVERVEELCAMLDRWLDANSERTKGKPNGD